MAKLKTTYVSGNLFVTESDAFVSASQFIGTASWAVSASEAVHAISASHVDANADLYVKSLHVSGNAQVDGNLKVLGDLEYVGVQDLRVKDKTIEINVNESGSAVASADDAGIVIKGTDSGVAANPIEIKYKVADDKLHFNRTIAGTIDNATSASHADAADTAVSASNADKVKFALTFGAGISKSVASFDGHEAAEIALDEDAVKAIKVTSASRADSAAEADKVAAKLHVKIQHSGSAAEEFDYDGSSVQSASVDFTAVEETLVSHSASIAEIEEEIETIIGGSGSIAEQIEAAIEGLDGDASASATGTAVSGGVFVLSGVAINEENGKLTSGSATSVEVEKAGAAAKAKADLLGAAGDATSSMTLYGVKNYVDAKTGEGVEALSQSVATDFSASDAARVALSESVAVTDGLQNDRLDALETASGSAISRLNTLESQTSSYAVSASVAGEFTADRLRLNALETASATHVAATTFNTYTSSANGRLDALESATASLGATYVTTASFNTYTQSVSEAQTAQDDRLSALETASGSAIDRLDAIESATASYVTSASLATIVADQAKVDATQSTRLDALETASSAAVSRLNSLESATASYADSASVATVTSASEARIAELEASASAITDDYVKKAGDTMSGDLNMASNAVVFGGMKMIWNATTEAIEFVVEE